MVYTNMKIPAFWCNKANYQKNFFDMLGKDKKFFDYISSQPVEEKNTEILTNSENYQITQDINKSIDFKTSLKGYLKKSFIRDADLLSSTKRSVLNKTRSLEQKNFLPATGINSETSYKSSYKEIKPNNKEGFYSVSSNFSIKKDNLTSKFTSLSENEERKTIFSYKNTKTHQTVQNKTETLAFLNSRDLKEVEIKNPVIKQMITECNGYGPYYSHCPICKNKNLSYFKDLKTDEALKVLKYIKKTKVEKMNNCIF